jgi:hypothetical protein
MTVYDIADRLDAESDVAAQLKRAREEGAAAGLDHLGLRVEGDAY